MILLALDPSIRSMGWAQFRDCVIQGSGVIRTQGSDDLARIGSITDSVLALIPDGGTVVIEVPPAFTFARSTRGGKPMNAASLQKLNWVVGAVVAAARARGVPIHAVSPADWKGRRSKAWDKTIAGKKSTDEADAIGIGRWWIAIGSCARKT